MTEEGIKKCFAVLNGAYMGFYRNMSSNDWALMKETWGIQFNNCEDLDVFRAVQICISKSEFPPSIAAIKKAMMPEDDENEEEVWQVLLKAGRNGGYESWREWEKLPEKLKAVTTPATIHEIAMADNETLHFIKKDILETYKTKKAKQVDKLLTSKDWKLLE